jgi:CSLREA domain-containing protein
MYAARGHRGSQRARSLLAFDINFSVTGTINLLSELPWLEHPNLTVQGPGANLLTVRRDNSAGAFTIFIVTGDAVTLNDLTVSNGDASGTFSVGGGIYSGGGLLTINRCHITGNTAERGGGVMSEGGDTHINDSAISSNMASAEGGGVYNLGGEGSSALTLTNCTISGNSVTGSGGPSTAGGVVAYADFGGSSNVHLFNCTITNNSTASSANAGGILSGTDGDPDSEANINLKNTILADNGSIQALTTSSGTITSQGNNLATDAAGGFLTGAGDLTNTNPLLAPLGDYGGPTPTHALRCGSPAIDAGMASGAPATEQRGLARNVDGNGDNNSFVDIGAFEVQKYLVTNAADSGAGSLRQAILDNNQYGGGLIAFDIAGAGVHTITPGVNLPQITKPANIDGYTQPGAIRNTLATGSDALLRVEIEGTNAGVNGSGLTLGCGYSCVRGLVINRFGDAALTLNGAVASHNWINGNYLGVSPDGTAARANHRGIWVLGGASNILGANGDGVNEPAERNLISGNTLSNGAGIALQLGAASNVIAGNYIGTNAAGLAALPNRYGVIFLQSSQNNTIGGTTSAARNVISGNQGVGIRLDTSDNTLIQGNYIGTAADGMSALGNQVGTDGSLTPGDGITIQASNGTTVGGTTAGAGNVIAFNAGSGVSVLASSLNNRMLGNAIYANTALGIDLGGNGVTTNDGGDGDAGQNNLQNFPVLTSVTSGGLVSGSLDSTVANSAYPVQLEFFANTTCDAAGHGEGEVYLGSLSLTTPGNFTFSFTPITGKNVITATATDADGNTSEFSACQVNVAPAVVSINRASANPTNATSVQFTVTFSESVTGVAAGNFTLVPSGALTGATITNVMGSATVWTVTINTGANSGTLGLDLTNSTGITDSDGEPLSNLPFTGQVYIIDKTAPTASLNASNVAAAGGASYSFTVTYSDNTAIEIASLGTGDVRVTGPGGFNSLATFNSVNSGTNGTPRTATYSITPPGGSWDVADNGMYTVALEASQVLDTVGNAGAAGALGTFQVLINMCPSTLTVNNLGDTGDANPGDGVCLTSGGVCTLRAAVEEANALVTPVLCSPLTINFSVTGTITLLSGELSVAHPNLTIQGPGANVLAVSGNGTSRVFYLPPGAPNNITIAGLSLINGNGVGAAGSSKGGAIYNRNEGALTLLEITISGSTATYGGAIEFETGNSSARLNLIRSTLMGNTASLYGGGIDPLSSGTLNVVNSTIAENQAQIGGGIGNSLSASVTINLLNVTITNNRALTTGGGIYLQGDPTVNIRNSILSLNAGADLTGHNVTNGLISTGYNLVGNLSPSVPTTLQPTDRFFSPHFETDDQGRPKLAFNGGPTQTIRLLPGSAALDQGAAATDPSTNQPLTTDQRGLPRPFDLPGILAASGGNNSDIGAFEVQCTTITLAGLPGGAVNTAYLQTNLASGGTAPYTLSVTGGALPPGVGISGNGLAGTPTLAGTFTFTLTAADGYGCTGSRSYTVTVVCPTITLTPTSLPGGSAGTPYHQSVAAAPAGAYVYSIVAGALPNGLTLNSATGALSGTPTTSGTFSFTIRATAGNCQGSQSYTLTIACPTVTWSPTTLPNAQAGIWYSQSVGVSAPGTYSYQVWQGNLPPGMTLDAQTGQITGLATVTGTYNFSLRALGADNCSHLQPYTILVVCPAITVTPTTLPGGTVGTAYNQTISATPAGNYTFAVSSSALPPGLSLSAAGLLSGTPTATGTFNFTVRAAGFSTCDQTRSYTVTIATSCAAITLPALPNSKVGVSYYGNLATTTPSGSYTFSVVSGTLPPGLVIDNLFAALTGKPTLAGTYNFTLKATRSNGCTGTRAYSVIINGTTAALAQVGDYDGDGKSDLTLWSAADGRWQILHSSDQQTETPVLGKAGDVPVLGDYDGDGRTDVAVFRPASGAWHMQQSSNGKSYSETWGTAGDVPTPGDYDGDGQTDLAIWRPSEGNWYIRKSSEGSAHTAAFGAGAAPYLDVPVPGDYDGDGRTDLAVFRRATGTWLIQRSSDGQFTNQVWGMGVDVPVAGDYDGDGKTDLAVWRGASGNWHVLRSSDQGHEVMAWGAAAAGDVPAPGDYDGDGKYEPGVWRAPAAQWHVKGLVTAPGKASEEGGRNALPVTSQPWRS